MQKEGLEGWKLRQVGTNNEILISLCTNYYIVRK